MKEGFKKCIGSLGSCPIDGSCGEEGWCHQSGYPSTSNQSGYPQDKQPTSLAKETGTRVINFVEKDISEMWPKWDSDVEDLPAENIIKVMYERRPWKWTMDCWEVTGTKVYTKPKVVTLKKAKEMVVLEEEEEEEEDNPRPRRKLRRGS
ncbi:hypothetical protein Bca52824_073284 [Brassica carinata]|uniref:Uncharacterized protein n=1 Tax=Brassica carinata TaxID=52824 RepID=A0A8X7U4Q1_BRACI|nr:hypothetical protein Bca52824_073284 [Brassica carinata]